MKTLAVCALIPAASAASAFVTLPSVAHSAASHPHQQVDALEALKVVDSEPVAPSLPDANHREAPSLLKWLGAGLLGGLLLAVSSAPANAIPAFTGSRFAPEKFTIKAAKHLELCKDNKKYHKKMKDQVYKITQRQKKYPAGSVVYNRFVKKIELVKAREEAYGDRYCGKKDGRPRVIATGENVRGGVVIPSLMFLYTAGWIGWAGRSYLIRTQDEKKELNIDVPLALTCMASGFSWPVACWQEIVNGELVVKDTDLHRSFF
mmetsp:Transcript_8535/g.9636  ORF Transcript_8535/g.9636 Transcript_8535/m.9636 type:complete len:262 (-) Transcript_8535:82-867(-)